jgi:two-component system cell cycle response regulator DivK
MATILIVEDNPTNMTLAMFLLQSAGHTVLSATDAEAGLTLARDEQPDLILMDIQLPGMDGLQATGLLKRGRRDARHPGDRAHRPGDEGRRGAHSSRGV